MRTITFKAGRRVWLMLVDGCEMGTTVPVSQPVDRAVLVAGKRFPGAVVDGPKQTSLFAEANRALYLQSKFSRSLHEPTVAPATGHVPSCRRGHKHSCL